MRVEHQQLAIMRNFEDTETNNSAVEGSIDQEQTSSLKKPIVTDTHELSE